MKSLIPIICLILFSFSGTAQTNFIIDDPSLIQVAEVSCGQCNFGLTSQQGCDLAIKFDGNSYWVDGSTLDSHGDSHALDGLCTMVRKAEVAGKLADGRFNVSFIKLLPLDKKE